MDNNIIEVKENEIRTSHVVATEIRTIANQTKRMMIVAAVEIGRRLVEAKSLVPHGSWSEWLKNEVSFSKSTANNYMKIFKEYSADQVGIIDTPLKSQTFGDLSYSQALKLLAVPSEDREDFIENNDIDKMSTRELQEAIKRAELAEKALGEAKKEHDKSIEDAKSANDRANKLEEDLKRKEEINELQEQTKKELEKLTKEARAEVKKLKESEENTKNSYEDKLKTKDTELSKLKDQLKAIEEKEKKSKELPKEEVEQIKKTAREEVIKEKENLEKQLETLSKEKEELNKKIKSISDNKILEFSVHFDLMQKEFKTLETTIVSLGDREKAEKLKNAVMQILEIQKDKLNKA